LNPSLIKQKAADLTEAAKAEPPKLIPKDVADKYLKIEDKWTGEDKFYFRKNKNVVIFEDKGNKLETKLNSPSVAADLVRIAAERGWKEIKITGTPEFKSEIWMEAESRGIATTGYTPTDIDRAMLKERLAKNTTNAIEEVKVLETNTPSVRQILEESANKKLAEQHIKTHPELKETIEYLDALKKQLEKSGASEKQIKVYMDTTKEGLAQMIEAGKYPEYQKVPVQQRQDTRQTEQQEPPKTQPQPQAQKEAVVTKPIKPKDQEMEIG
jgi:putative DNA primase/helicase